jgi:hypothetical protein
MVERNAEIQENFVSLKINTKLPNLRKIVWEIRQIILMKEKMFEHYLVKLCFVSLLKNIFNFSEKAH